MWKSKILSEEALQIAIKRIEQQGEIRKPFSVNNEKKKKGINRMEKTRDLFKKLEIPRERFMQRWAQ